MNGSGSRWTLPASGGSFARMWRVAVLFGLIAVALPGSAQAGEAWASADVQVPYSLLLRLQFQHGDDPRWADPRWDDSDWRNIAARDLPSRSGVYWVRWRVRLPREAAERPQDGLLLKIVASYEVYWDGQLIGRNGVVGATPAEERPGNVDALFQVPRELLGPGEHVIALRLSSWHTGFPSSTYGVGFVRGNFRELLVSRSRTAIFSVMAVGAALVVALVFGLMWLLAARRLPLLLFATLFLAVALMQALQAWRWLFDYPYPWHYPRLVAITWLVMAIAVLLPAFVMHFFRVGPRPWVYAGLAAILTAAWFLSPYYNWISLYASGTGFFTALGLALRAAWCRRRGAVFAWVGLTWSGVALLGAPNDFLDHAFFLSAGPAVLGLLVALVLQLRDERREAQRAVLAAARLETELLKKNLQPHFLLNTLATIQEVIERDPRTAVAMIDALAAEFRILMRVSGEKLITLGQELELCRAHLQVMTLRKGATCTLSVVGADEAALVPPALLHTLIENGLTHLMPRHGRIEFELRADRPEHGARYTLLARGERAGGPHRSGEGTGLRYIRARLEESFTGAWSLSAGPVPGGWETVIEIRSPAAEPGRAVLATPQASVPRTLPA